MMQKGGPNWWHETKREIMSPKRKGKKEGKEEFKRSAMIKGFSPRPNEPKKQHDQKKR